MMERELSRLENAIYCLVEAMGMQAENMQRQRLGESMAYTAEEFDMVIQNWKG